MSIITHSENASQSHHDGKQIGAEEASAQGNVAKQPKSLSATTNGQPRRSKLTNGAVAGRKETSVHPDVATATASTPAASTRPKKVSKQDTVLELLRQTEGATIDELMDATAWQAHSVRGFLSGTARKKLKLNLISDVVGNGVRRYRVVSTDQAVRSSEAGGQPSTDVPASVQGA